jgi:hypothetical protein
MIRRPSAVPWLLGAGAFAVYAATLNRIHTWDALAYAARTVNNRLVSERYLSTTFWHPHHLLYIALSSAWLRLTRALGVSDPTGLLPLQLMSAFFGAGIVALTALTAQQASNRRGPTAGGTATMAVIAGTGAGLSNALWRYSTAVEVMTPSLFFLLLGACLLLDRRSALRTILAGAALAVAMLLHQIAVFFALGFLLSLLPGALGNREKMRGFALAVLTALILTAGTYLAVAVFSDGITTRAGTLDWLTRVRNRAHFADTPLAKTILFTALTVIEAFLTRAPLAALKHHRLSDSTLAGSALTLLAAAGLILLVCQFRRERAAAPSSHTSWYRGLLAGGIMTVLFVAWFEPSNLEYMVYIVPFAWLWLCGRGEYACASSAGTGPEERASKERGSRRFHDTPSPSSPVAPVSARRFRLLATVSLLLLGAANLAGSILPERRATSAPYGDILAFAEEHLRPGDTFIFREAEGQLGMACILLPLYRGANVLALPALAATGGPSNSREELRETLFSSEEGHGKAFCLDDAFTEICTATGERFDSIGVGCIQGRRVLELSRSRAGSESEITAPLKAGGKGD